MADDRPVVVPPGQACVNCGRINPATPGTAYEDWLNQEYHWPGKCVQHLQVRVATLEAAVAKLMEIPNAKIC